MGGSDPTVSGCTFSDNYYSLYITSSPTAGANLTGNTINQGASRPIFTRLEYVDNLVFGNTINPRADGVYNGIHIQTSTISESWTMPDLPHDFLYYITDATIYVRGASGPVLTIPSGQIVKLWSTRFEIGSTTEAGGLMADGVIFTSIRDDEGGDTDGVTSTPGAANWQRIEFKAMARADSSRLTNCELRYGGSGSGVLRVGGSDPTVSGCTFSDNNYSLYITSSPTAGANLTGNTINQGAVFPIHTPLQYVENLALGNTINPRADGVYNGISIAGSTVSESLTLPQLPLGFVYYLNGQVVTVAGASNPVLAIPPDQIVKLWSSRFDIGTNSVAGGLIADGVLFTSIRDDEGGDTDGTTNAPAPGNWQRIDFNPRALITACRMADCEVRYGGSGSSGMVEAYQTDPTFVRCVFTKSSSAALWAHGEYARPSLWFCTLAESEHGLRTNAGHPHLLDCCFEDNEAYGLWAENFDPESPPVMAEGCWWGATDGPAGAGPGSGDSVSTHVDFEPWADQDICIEPLADLVWDPVASATFQMQRPQPNPFGPATLLRFALPRASAARVEVFGVDGRRVATLLDEEKAAGWHEVLWRGTDDRGHAVGAGVYFCRIQVGRETRTRRVTLVR